MAPIHKVALWLIVALATLAVGRAVDSFLLDLEDLDEIDLTALGTPSLERYLASYEVTVDATCNYLLKLEFVKPSDETPGEASSGTEFTGVCDPENGNTGTAPDGQPWHANRRYWMQLPQYVFDTTGFDHISIYWRPCGLPPKGQRQPRYEVVFYTVIPQYRAFFTCEEFGTPARCLYNQTSTFGRAHFVVPRLERDPNFYANMPLGFKPDFQDPEVYQYEGLIHWDDDLIPETPANWSLPNMDMTTYDGDVTSFRVLLPYNYVHGNSTTFFETKYYVYQTMPRLPYSWNMTFDAPSEIVSVYLSGSAGMCGAGFEAAKGAAEEQAASTRKRQRRGLGRMNFWS